MLKTLKEYAFTGKLLIAAHRGSSGTAPENTMAAYKEAIESGADMIETDIQLTKDGHFITFHDPSFIRTTSLKNKNSDLTLDNIKNLDAGSWFDPKYSNERIPLLSELLELARNRVYLSIEIKQIHSEKDTYFRKLLDLIYKFEMQSNVVLASFHYSYLKKINQMDKNIHLSAIKLPFDFRLPSSFAKNIGTQAYICSLKELSDRIVENACKNNVFVGIYGVDSIEQLKKALSFKINVIGTNFPALIINELKKMNLL